MCTTRARRSCRTARVSRWSTTSRGCTPVACGRQCSRTDVRFKRSRHGVEAKLEPVEAEVLAQCAGELLELLGSGEEASDDPLEAMVGLPPGDVSPPDDPALARLFPAAYADDEAAATEFRRFTESDLRAGKRAAATDALVVLQPLLPGGGKLALDRDQADA